MNLRIDGMAPLLQVFDMPASLAFYRDILGFERVDDSGNGDASDWVWLRLDGVDLMLNTAYEADDRPPIPDPARIAAHPDTGLFFSCRDVDAAYAYLLSKGLRLEPPKIQSYGMKQLYVADPDGYSLCFQQPAWLRREGTTMAEKIVPMINVPDVRATAGWYESIGFTLAASNEDCGEMNWALLTLGKGELMLNAGGKPSAESRRDVDLYVHSDDVDALFSLLKDRAEIVEGLHDTFYGMREFIIRDCNRFWITFGQQAQGEPEEGAA